MNTEDINKKLKLNAGICKRLLKEVASYEKEVQTQENKVQKMRDEERDPYGQFLKSILSISLAQNTSSRHSKARGSTSRELHDGARQQSSFGSCRYRTTFHSGMYLID